MFGNGVGITTAITLLLQSRIQWVLTLEEGEFEEVVQTETGFNTSESAIGPHQTPTPFKPELDLE